MDYIKNQIIAVEIKMLDKNPDKQEVNQKIIQYVEPYSNIRYSLIYYDDVAVEAFLFKSWYLYLKDGHRIS